MRFTLLTIEGRWVYHLIRWPTPLWVTASGLHRIIGPLRQTTLAYRPDRQGD